uniref:Uncharacterized protein n=1 Tax=Romanomermis culicivorax TaxID=13658 RepID=A0A915J751_ROMCU
MVFSNSKNVQDNQIQRTSSGLERTFDVMIAVYFLLIFVLIRVNSNFINIPGCQSLYQFDFSQNLTTIPKCYCDNATRDSDIFVQINCVTSSSIQDLAFALDKVSLFYPRKQVIDVRLDYMIFDHEGLPDDFFLQRNAFPRSMAITNCLVDQSADYPIMLKKNVFRALERNLTSLTIMNCDLRKFPQSIRNLSNLVDLELSRCSIDDINEDDFENLKNLKNIDLSSNNIRYLNRTTVKNWALVTNLNFQDNYLRDESVEVLSNLTNLYELDLSQNFLTSESQDYLRNLKNLQKLDLSSNSISELRKTTFDKLENMQILDISGNRINRTGAQTFSQLNSLKKLFLGGNFIDENMLKNLGLNKALNVIDISYNKLREITNLTFPSMHELMFLDLSNNVELTLKDNYALADFPSLAYLNLSSTNISNFDRDTLKSSAILTTLDLSFTPISQLRPDVFQNSVQLAGLYLAGTQLQALPQNVFQNLRLLEIDLSQNDWTCDSNLTDWLPKWLVENNRNNRMKIVDVAETKCLRPEKFVNETLVRIYDQNFDLPTTTTVTFSSISQFSTSTTTLSIPSTAMSNNASTNETSKTKIRKLFLLSWR